MASQSKEDAVLELFLEESPLKRWSFSEIMKKSRVTRAVTNKWIRKYVKEGLLKRVCVSGHFPFYSVGSGNMVYLARKRWFLLKKIYDSGLFTHLLSLPEAKTVVLFGSVMKGDWYARSDIDIFLYGSATGFEKLKYEKKMGRCIELHQFENAQEIAKVKTGLIKNVINGFLIKGILQDIGVKV